MMDRISHFKLESRPDKLKLNHQNLFLLIGSEKLPFNLLSSFTFSIQIFNIQILASSAETVNNILLANLHQLGQT